MTREQGALRTWIRVVNESKVLLCLLKKSEMYSKAAGPRMTSELKSGEKECLDSTGATQMNGLELIENICAPAVKSH
jgi:hypothetical protein